MNENEKQTKKKLKNVKSSQFANALTNEKESI